MGNSPRPAAGSPVPPVVMTALVLLLPLGGVLAAGPLGRWVGVRGATWLTTGAMALTALVVVLLYHEVCLTGSPLLLPLGQWLPLAWVGGEVGLAFDPLTLSMLLPVVVISALVHLFSIGYMAGDPHVPRFFATLSLFTLAMILLVTADSLLLLFAGWEGVGLCSYLLVSFWATRVAASLAALKAFLMNRVGDWALTLLLLGALASLGEGSLPLLLASAPYLDPTLRTGAALLLTLGAMAKSAQLGLHTWLPSAMEGPTPVSALIHAATMVTAGVYLLLRFSPLLEFTETGLLLVTALGALTALYGALSGTVEHDVKRVIAYSTTSQLGYMVVAVGLSAHPLALFHLVNHAFFKALLFLSAGALLHAVGDEQDLRRLGGLARLLPRTATMLLIGSLSLLALPFLTGFYSKDPILEIAVMGGSLTARVAYLATLGAAFLTALYSVRLLLLTFLLPPSLPRARLATLHDPTGVLFLPLLLLSILSVGFGAVAKEVALGGGSPLFGGALFTHPDHLLLADAEWLPTPLRFLPLLPLLLGLLLLPRPQGWQRGSLLLLLTVVDWTALPQGATDVLLLAVPLYLAHLLPFLLIALLLTATLVGVLLLLAPSLPECLGRILPPPCRRCLSRPSLRMPRSAGPPTSRIRPVGGCTRWWTSTTASSSTSFSSWRLSAGGSSAPSSSTRCRACPTAVRAMGTSWSWGGPSRPPSSSGPLASPPCASSTSWTRWWTPSSR